jgi:hypothetical protein
MKTITVEYNSETDKLIFELKQRVDERTFSMLRQRLGEFVLDRRSNALVVPVDLIDNVIVLKNTKKVSEECPEENNSEIHTPTRMLRIVEDEKENV